MARYIELDALLAEIERLESKNYKNSNEFNLGAATYLGILKHYINTLEVKEEDAIKWRTDIPQGDLIVAKVKYFFCDKKDCYEVLHFASKPYPHYYDAWGEEVPYSAIEKWCLIK